MEDRELEEIKRRKMMELMQQSAAQENVEERRREEEEAARQAILRQILEPEARERLARIKLVRPELAEAVENQLIILAQSGRLGRMITDDELKSILSRLTSQRREIRIERR
ncbi:DNA-binding protein [Aciduliprofundum sp. MAR08-339]|uniref:DNA-binding protein n=1 Tax=Aciduliprofundum sp. (strain MAR08-339) TaxID=673860 RepID=UPI0002A4B15D|nr:DNA-binding protein [Aciduliprofundum sp. MAR08-339]